MTITYTRIDKDTVEQKTTFEPIINRFVQSDMQSIIDGGQHTLDSMPEPTEYPDGATEQEKHLIDEWNIKNSNKFEKENLKESINTQTKFLDQIKAVV